MKCQHIECSNDLPLYGNKYCSLNCYNADRWRNYRKTDNSKATIKCICPCGCNKPVSPSTLKKPVVFASKGCRSYKTTLADQGIIPEYRVAKLRKMGLIKKKPLVLKHCLNPKCDKKVKNNKRHFCSQTCARDAKEHIMHVSLRKYAPEGYLSFLQRNFIYDRLVEGDRVALEVLRRLHLTKVFHNGITVDLIGRCNKHEVAEN